MNNKLFPHKDKVIVFRIKKENVFQQKIPQRRKKYFHTKMIYLPCQERKKSLYLIKMKELQQKCRNNLRKIFEI